MGHGKTSQFSHRGTEYIIVCPAFAGHMVQVSYGPESPITFGGQSLRTAEAERGKVIIVKDSIPRLAVLIVHSKEVTTMEISNHCEMKREILFKGPYLHETN